ncbi:MAG: hypothetical protein M0P38_01315 [Bacteroidales bacterium]|jgi:hypothetical protein|nr:hypothetical protein [Bacteroidales bacterium]
MERAIQRREKARSVDEKRKPNEFLPSFENPVFHTSFAAAVRLFAERAAFHRDLIF